MNRLEMEIYEKMTERKNLSPRQVRKLTTGTERASVRAYIQSLRSQIEDEVNKELEPQK